MTRRVSELESKFSGKTFELIQKINDLSKKNDDHNKFIDEQLRLFEKTVVDNGVGLVQKISELEAVFLDLSERFVDLNMIIRDLRSGNLFDQKPPVFPFHTHTPSISPAGITTEGAHEGHRDITPLQPERKTFTMPMAGGFEMDGQASTAAHASTSSMPNQSNQPAPTQSTGNQDEQAFGFSRFAFPSTGAPLINNQLNASPSHDPFQ